MKLRALVVDSSTVSRRIFISALEHADLAEFKFEEASGGEKALRSALANPPDMIFCEWNLTGMSGFDLIKYLRKDPQHLETPIIVVTGEKSIGRIDDALNRAGATEYIVKPFSKEDLARKLAPIVEAVRRTQVSRETRKRVLAEGSFLHKLLGEL